MARHFGLLEAALGLASALVVVALVVQIMSGLGGAIPDGHDAPALLRTMVEVLLLNTLVLAWTAFLRRGARS